MAGTGDWHRLRVVGLACAALAVAAAGSGCALVAIKKDRGVERRMGVARAPELHESQSLLSIGEVSLTAAEDMEDEGRDEEARELYKRAIWAFQYHQTLTGVKPILLDAALEGMERVESGVPDSTRPAADQPPPES